MRILDQEIRTDRCKGIKMANQELASHDKRACIIEETSIAGTGRIKDIEKIVGEMERGDALGFERDESNFFDQWAVKVFDPSGRRLGFVSCDCNEIISRMLDADFKVEGVFDSATDRDGWMDIKIKVMLNG